MGNVRRFSKSSQNSIEIIVSNVLFPMKNSQYRRFLLYKRKLNLEQSLTTIQKALLKKKTNLLKNIFITFDKNMKNVIQNKMYRTIPLLYANNK